MTSSGLSAPKIAVPATMTLLPKQTFSNEPCLIGAKTEIGNTCLSTNINRLGTYTSIHFNVFIREPRAEFCDLGNASLDKLLPSAAWKRSFECQKGRWGKHSPGYTVMTRSRSASSPTSSDIEVDGVSGEIATPAFMRLSWMAWIRGTGSAASR